MHAYLDNAATTPIDKRVLEVMMPFLENHFGNPSSIHALGRVTKSAIEQARKTVAQLLHTSPSEIFFTSGGTEADNFLLIRSIEALDLSLAITTPLEHHAVLHTLEYLEKLGKIKLKFVEIDQKGNINYDHLKQLLAEHSPKRALVTLMHGNNEIGNLADLQRIGELAQEFNAFFHSDTVQTMGHYAHNLQTLKIDSLIGAGHKFHAPKGVGFMYLNAKNKLNPYIHGGAQERNMRGGTENVYGIIGLAKALELAYQDMQHHQDYIISLKKEMITGLKNIIPDVKFNGESENLEKSLYTVLNVSLPPHPDSDMLLFNLDIQGVCASGGSACSSGSEIGSHVLRALKVDKQRGAVRFSFSRFTTIQEIQHALNCMAQIFQLEIKN
jgi:cysteine desulfurase